VNFLRDLFAVPFLGRVRRLWSDLTDEEQEWAKQLGYEKSLWDR
jgi:hypothetical protein